MGPSPAFLGAPSQSLFTSDEIISIQRTAGATTVAWRSMAPTCARSGTRIIIPPSFWESQPLLNTIALFSDLPMRS